VEIHRLTLQICRGTLELLEEPVQQETQVIPVTLANLPRD
jgi:hypothetical protein